MGEMKTPFSFFKRLFLITLCLGLSSCATKTLAPNAHRSGEWSAKAQVTELSTGKSQQVSLDIISVWPRQLRIEATAILGISVAVLAVEEGHFQLLLPRERKYYVGYNSERSLQNFFKVAINPEWLINATFDQDLRGSEWTCQDEQPAPNRICKNSRSGVSVAWRERNGDQKRVVLSNATHEVQILYKSFSDWDPTKVQENDSHSSPFRLPIPEGFTKYNIM
jgi:hypothetical protein